MTNSVPYFFANLKKNKNIFYNFDIIFLIFILVQMKNKSISLVLGFVMIVFVAGFSVFSWSALLKVWPQLVLGKPFNVQIFILEVLFLFTGCLFFYFILGAEGKIDKKNPPSDIAFHVPDATISRAEATTNVIKLDEKDELAYLTYQKQAEGPSIFKDADWKRKLEKGLSPIQPLMNAYSLQSKVRDDLPVESSFLIMDLEELSEPIRSTSRLTNPLEKNIEELFNEQNEMLESLKKNQENRQSFDLEPDLNNEGHSKKVSNPEVASPGLFNPFPNKFLKVVHTTS